MKNVKKFRKHRDEIEEKKIKIKPAGKKRKRSLRNDLGLTAKKKYKNYFEEE